MQVEELYKKCTEQFTPSDDQWRMYLKIRNKLHHYSMMNVFLIYSQNPGVRLVRGFSQWKQLGRYVKKGEKAIYILAPLIQKIKSKDADLSDTTVLKGFKTTTVFDLSQTDGDDSKIPSVITGLQFPMSEEVYSNIKELLSHDLPITENTGFNSKGFYSNGPTPSITINSTYAVSQKLKTLLHEYAHYVDLAVLPKKSSETVDSRSDSEKEVIAESTAFLAMDFLGFNTEEYSVPYLKAWLNNDLTVFAKLGARIDKVMTIVRSRLASMLEVPEHTSVVS